MDTTRSAFPGNLRRMMEIQGRTRRDISSALGVSYTSVMDWCNGKKIPRMEKIDALAKYLNCSKMDLLEEPASTSTEVSQEASNESAELVSLTASFQKLNDTGKQEAVKRVEELTQIPRYTREELAPISFQDSGLRAAHNDNTDPDQLEKMRQDLEWLKNQ